VSLRTLTSQAYVTTFFFLFFSFHQLTFLFHRQLGVDNDGNALAVGGGMVGQQKAREAAAIAVELIRSKKLAGHALLLAGAPGVGKTGWRSPLRTSSGARCRSVPWLAAKCIRPS
jgi:DNA helicase TIP49 (TBP-interacting protein)